MGAHFQLLEWNSGARNAFPLLFLSSAICFASAFAANKINHFLLYKETSQFFEHCSHNSLKVLANTSLQSVDNALMHLSSTAFELDDLDQEDQDSLDSWVHHLLIAVDHVSTPLFSPLLSPSSLVWLFFDVRSIVAYLQLFLFSFLHTESLTEVWLPSAFSVLSSFMLWNRCLWHLAFAPSYMLSRSLLHYGSRYWTNECFFVCYTRTYRSYQIAMRILFCIWAPVHNILTRFPSSVTQVVLLNDLRFTQLGGLLLERSVRRIVFHLSTSFPEAPCRELFGRVLQISMMLSMESPSEVLDYWNDLLERLSEIEIKRVLSLRSDFRVADVNALGR